MTERIIVNAALPNVFRALLPYRGRPGRESRENFLTEAFAHFLATQNGARAAIIDKLAPNVFRVQRVAEIETQASIPDGSGSGRCIPDIRIRAHTSAGVPCEIWIENKWPSQASPDQLSRYLDAMATLSREDEVRRHLTLLTPRIADLQVIKALTPPLRLVTLSGTTWSDIHQVMAKAAVDTLGTELVVFMKEEGLGGLEIVNRAEAVDHFRRISESRKSHPFRQKLVRFCSMLLNEPRIAVMPDLQDAVVNDTYGRVCLWTGDAKVSLGFLYNPADHATAFLEPNTPLDICIRIEANPVGVDVEAIRKEFSWVASHLGRAGFSCDTSAGRWRTNRHTIVLGHYHAGFPFDQPTPQAQYEALLSIFSASLDAIFNDPKIARKVKGLKPY